MFTDAQGTASTIGTVLVLEDEALVSAVVEDCLLDAGARVLLCFSLEEALRAIDEREVHCAVLDVQVGGDYSFGVADALAARDVPFVFASAYGADDIAEQHRHRPLLAKPFSNEALVVAVRGLLAEGEAGGRVRPPDVSAALWDLDIPQHQRQAGCDEV